jgi:diguanylate cyclase (GGDEF)-like protein
MQIDALTVLLVGLFVKLVLAGLFFAFWVADRRAIWYGWWAGTLLVACGAATAIALRGRAPDVIGIGVGTALIILTVACGWQTARVFDRRRPLWSVTLAAPAIWLGVCLLPGFLGNVALRILLSGLLISPLVALTAVEFWRGRREALPSRRPVIVLYSVLALFFAARLPLLNHLPFPFGALPAQPGWLGAFGLFTFSHCVLLSVLLIAMSKERFELDQRIKAQTDPLTGALNRRAFMTRGTRLLARHAHQGAPLCVLFLDLDHFKSLNDRFGHSGGDDMLVRVVNHINASIRPTDFLFRIGGEEFCCLLPHTGEAQARSVGERIRRRIETAVVTMAGLPVRVTASIGVASTETFGYDLDLLTRRADDAVYAAKRGGRNRVVVATAEEAPMSEAVAAPLRRRGAA